MQTEPPAPTEIDTPAEPPTTGALIGLARGWWIAVVAACVVCLAAVVAALAADDVALAAAFAVVAFTVLLTGAPVVRKVVPAVGFAAVLVVFIALEEFDGRARTALLVAAAAAVAGWAGARLRSREEQLQEALVDLHARAERRSIRDAVQESLASRRRDNYVEREFVRAQRYGREVTVAVAEVDNLELLRREKGPEATQEVLVRLGELFAADSRLPDGGLSDDLRLVFVLPETPLLGGRVVAERVRLNFASSKLQGADGVPLTVSIGVASYPMDGERVHEVIGSAQSALADAVGKGGNRTILTRSPAGTPAGWSIGS